MVRTSIIAPVRSYLNDLPRQLRENALWILVVAFVLTVMTAIVVYLHNNTHIIVTELFEDPVEFGILPQHVGMFSFLGAMTMIVAGAFMVLSAWTVVSLARELKLFMSALGGFLLWLGIDDVFMIHEWVGLRLAWLMKSDDVPRDRQWLESVVFVAYGLAWIAIVVVFWKPILRTPWFLLALTLIGFSTSVVLDVYAFIDFLPNVTTQTRALAKAVIEDMGKVAGGFFALAYSVRLVRSILRGQAECP